MQVPSRTRPRLAALELVALVSILLLMLCALFEHVRGLEHGEREIGLGTVE